MSDQAISSLGRPALQETALRAAVLGVGSPWTSLRVLARTGSTNADLVEAARSGLPPGAVLLAETQTAGRGRLGRVWASPPRAGLAMSVLLDPRPLPAAKWGWVPLLAGVASAEAIEAVAQTGIGLKWPNDLLSGAAKVGGVLAERVEAPDGPVVVVGIGLNVSLTAAELADAVPAGASVPPGSLLLAGARSLDRTALVIAILDRLAGWLADLAAQGGDPARLRAAYLARSVTVGQHVAVLGPLGPGRPDTPLLGRATGVDADGALLVAVPDGTTVTISAGDVLQVRPPGGEVGQDAAQSGPGPGGEPDDPAAPARP